MKTIAEQFKNLGFEEQANRVEKAKKEERKVDEELKNMVHLKLDHMEDSFLMFSTHPINIALAIRYGKIATEKDWSRNLLTNEVKYQYNKVKKLFEEHGTLGRESFLASTYDIESVCFVKATFRLLKNLVANPDLCKDYDFKSKVLAALKEYETSITKIQSSNNSTQHVIDEKIKI